MSHRSVPGVRALVVAAVGSAIVGVGALSPLQVPWRGPASTAGVAETFNIAETAGDADRAGSTASASPFAAPSGTGAPSETAGASPTASAATSSGEADPATAVTVGAIVPAAEPTGVLPGWQNTAEGFSRDFATPGDDWIDRLAPWTSAPLLDQLALSDPLRRPAGTLVSLRDVVEGDSTVWVLATYAGVDGLRLNVRLDLDAVQGWKVTDVVQADIDSDPRAE